MSLKWYLARLQERREVVVLSEIGEHVVVDGQSRKPLQMKAGWKPTRVLNFGGSFSIVFLKQDVQAGPDQENHAERLSGWLITSRYEFVSVVGQVREAPGDLEFRGQMAKALVDEMKEFLSGRHRPISPEHLLLTGEKEILRQFLTPLDSRQACGTRPLSEFVEGGLINSKVLHYCARDFTDSVNGLVKPDSIHPMLVRRAGVTHVRHIPLEHGFHETAHLCWTDKLACSFVILLNRSKQVSSFVYVPESNVVFGEDFSGPAVDFFNRIMVSLFLILFSSKAQQEGQHYRHDDCGGLLLAGLKNFGHAIWEEFYALDYALRSKSQWPKTPFFYVLKGSGADLYGPLEDLYPELEGRFVYFENFQELMDHAFLHGVQLFKHQGRCALRATRDRIIALSARHGESQNLVRRAAVVGGNILQRRPAIALGLRLTNRHPVDPLGFYVRLTQALVQRFGQLSLILDGMNVDSGTGQPAAFVYNPAFAPRGRSDGRAEIAVELGFVDQFRAAVAALPVQVLSCVGLPILDNLYWLSQADFFVAPNGGGLAKLRWALDIPGYVLTSRVNFEYCSLVNVYGDYKNTEEPFSPIYMNEPDEVEDVPIDPPRSEGLKVRGIPYPENFKVAEDSVIPKICDLIQLSLERRGDADAFATP